MTVSGRVTYLRISEEEGGTDWALAVSKLCWYAVCVLFPISLFRFLDDLFGPFLAVVGVLALALAVRLFGPLNLVMLDELLSRLFPPLRSAVRMGRVPVYEFRVLTDEGRDLACILKGPLRASGPVVGDALTLEGRIRWGTFWVRRGVNCTTDSHLRSRPVRSGWILMGTCALVGVFVLYLAGTFDELIYAAIERLIKEQ